MRPVFCTTYNISLVTVQTHVRPATSSAHPVLAVSLVAMATTSQTSAAPTASLAL